MGVTLHEAVNGIPSCDSFVDPSLPPSELEFQVRGVCRALIERWTKVEDGHLCVTTVSGGITNLLMKVSLKDSEAEDDSVTVRIFGPNTDAVIDRKREFKATLFLSDAGFGAKLLGIFQNGMIQSFIDAQTLTPNEMSSPRMAAHIAKEVRRLHEVDVPGSKDPELWTDISKFLDKASFLTFDDSTKQRRYTSISFKVLREELQALKDMSDLLSAPIVFSHNDLLSGNLMYSEAKDKLYIIDYEYGSYNYRGYDIGNHFAEYAGFECDYSLYPDKEMQYHFFRHYLDAQNARKASEAELEELYTETNFYTLASHLFWAVWAIVQAKFSPISFDYLEYFFQRYAEYENKKNENLSLVRNYLAKLGRL